MTKFRGVDRLVLVLIVVEVGASRDSILRGLFDSRTEENLALNSFFGELIRLIDRGTWNLHHVTILSEDANDFDVASPLCHNHSRFMGVRTKEFALTREFSRISLVVAFLDHLTVNSARQKNKESTAMCVTCRYMFVVRGHRSEESISATIRFATTISNSVEVIHVKGSRIKHYVPMMKDECEVAAKMTIDWKIGDTLDSWGSLRNVIYDFRGCKIPVVVKGSMPLIKLESRNDILELTDGLETEIIRDLAKALNFTIEVIPLVNQNNDTLSAQRRLVRLVELSKVGVGMGHLIFTPELAEVDVNVLFQGFTDHLVWCVPFKPASRYNALTHEFSWTIWIGLFVVIVAFVGFVRAFQRASTIFRDRSPGEVGPRPSLRRISMGRGDEIRTKTKGWISTALDAFSMCLGNPVVFDPIYDSTKILVVTFLLYATVLTTAYKSSLSSMLTTGHDRPAIVDVKGIIEANLTTGGPRTHYDVLVEQINATAENPELVRRFEIFENAKEALIRMQTKQDLAYLGLKSDIDYESCKLARSGRLLTIYHLPYKVLTFSSVLILPKQSYLYKPFYKLLTLLNVGGMQRLWYSRLFNGTDDVRALLDDAYARQNIPGILGNKHIFYLYSWCSAISILIFALEIIIHRYA